MSKVYPLTHEQRPAVEPSEVVWLSASAGTGKTQVLALPGGGPFVLRLMAERWFMDHRSRGVVIVLDDFAFAHRRWNEDRLADDDLLPKIPADVLTARVLRLLLNGAAPESILCLTFTKAAAAEMLASLR